MKVEGWPAGRQAQYDSIPQRIKATKPQRHEDESNTQPFISLNIKKTLKYYEPNPPLGGGGANFISNFSPHLFWDVKKEELDMQANKNYIIKQVLEYGLYEDWKTMLAYYGIEQIKDAVISFRQLEPKALNLIAILSNTPRENFRCYTTKQSANPHWNF